MKSEHYKEGKKRTSIRPLGEGTPIIEYGEKAQDFIAFAEDIEVKNIFKDNPKYIKAHIPSLATYLPYLLSDEMLNKLEIDIQIHNNKLKTFMLINAAKNNWTIEKVDKLLKAYTKFIMKNGCKYLEKQKEEVTLDWKFGAEVKDPSTQGLIGNHD